MEQNPFSLYDFLGYFAPGAIFSLGVLLVFSKCGLNPVDLQDESSTYQWLIAIVFILFSYVFGFALSIISGELVEKYLIWRSGYPSKVRYAVPQKTFIECLFDDGYRGHFYLFFFLVFLFPVLILDLLFGKCLGLEKKYFKRYRYPDELSILKRHTYKVLGLLTENPESLVNSNANFFKYLYHYTYENESAHSRKMQNYVALYGFSRTMTLIFSLFFLVNLGSVGLRLSGYTCISFHPFDHDVLFLLSSALLAYTFFVGFAKYYRRYTDEVLMATVAMVISKQNVSPSNSGSPDVQA
ncbi:hypothetical protein [Pseudodesulfovibrio sp.]|uniref:hypothetical protein n=1 Tax=Pseudodesulfovibrio sp. TaxID=2035812 RepID=UPI00260AD0F7|nr:hypothetical protein [Pseudodesulfovibrio sp.]MDD3313678.1 hypothetical protein [Pseudodesulfovibrio sp.]